MQYRYPKPSRRRGPRFLSGGTAAVLFALLAAVLIPTGLIFAQRSFGPETAPESSSSSASDPAGEALPSSAPDTESLASSETAEPAEPEPVYGLVAESETVGPEYFDDAVFFGDSITTGITVYPEMANATVIALTGVNPDSVFTKKEFALPGEAERLSMMEALRRISPGKIYVMLGANWVGENTQIQEETFLKHYRTMVEAIREEHPDSILYLQSMLPVSKAFESNEKGNNKPGITNELIRRYNEALEQLAAQQSVYYLDLYGLMADAEGCLPIDATSDGMHITADYYKRWFDYLARHTASAPVSDGNEGKTPGDEGQASS